MPPQSETSANSTRTPIGHAEELHEALQAYIGSGGKIAYAG